MRVRYFEQSTTSESPTVWPACEVPPPRASTRDALGAGKLQRPLGFLDGSGRDHAHRHDLVMRGVGRITAAREAVEVHIPAQFGLQPPFQAGHYHRHGVFPFLGCAEPMHKSGFVFSENRLTAMLHS